MHPKIREYGLSLAVLILFFGVAFICSKNSLRQGQLVKQFTASSITQSLAKNGFSPLRSTLPCPHPYDQTKRVPWAEEPPIYHLFGALLLSAGLQQPAWPSLIISLAIGLVVLFFLSSFYKYRGKRLALALLVCLSVPIFWRYSYQHMPGILALFWLCLGSYSLGKGKTLWALILFILAVTTKALVIFPITGMWFWSFVIYPWIHQKRVPQLKSFLSFILGLALCIAPFLAWLFILKETHVPNPFDFSEPLKSRHSGDWQILIEARYWERLLLYAGPRGVGIPLLFGFLYSARAILRKWRKPDYIEGLLLCWALSVLPSWILVRSGSFIHDHYFLAYSIPICLLGFRAIEHIPRVPIRLLVLWLSILSGVYYPLSYRWKVSSQIEPPSFCEQEMHSIQKFFP